MKFKINNRNWEIEEVDKEWLLGEYKKEVPETLYCFGLTRYSVQKIFINKELCDEVKRQTLYHELMHCYLWSHVFGFNNLNEEEICDVVANSHDIIHKIADDYFKTKKD